MPEIQAVIFDVGGVLHQHNTAVADDIARELSLDPAALDAIWRDHMPLLGKGQIEEAEFWRQVSDEHGVRQVGVEENLLGRAFAETLRPYPEIKALVAELGRHGLKLAILSNTIEPHARVLRETGVYDGFDKLVLSHEVGMSKPGPGIYLHTLRELDVEPNEVVFTDDREENITAAQSLGMHGILFTDPSKFIEDLRQFIPDL